MADTADAADSTVGADRPAFVRIDLDAPARRWFLLFAAIGAAVGLLAALLYSLVVPPVYEATVFADFERLAPDATSGIYASIDRVSLEANSTATFRAVIDELELEETVAELRSMVVIKPLFGNPSIRVTATSTDADLAEDVAAAFVEAMEGMPVPQDLSDDTPNYRVDLRNPIDAPLRPTSPKPGHDLVAGAFLGLAAGLIAASLRRTASAVKTTGATRG